MGPMKLSLLVLALLIFETQFIRHRLYSAEILQCCANYNMLVTKNDVIFLQGVRRRGGSRGLT
jgi:hypothetical protein